MFDDKETQHSHGSYPRADTVQFYLSYHAMMVVAGELLEKVPVLQEVDGPKDRFRDWLFEHELTRLDGCWVADRRDPAPLEWPPWKDETNSQDWRWSVQRQDFDRALFAPQARMNLWGQWTMYADHRKESVAIRSALVSPQTSTALLRALQSVVHPIRYRIPEADDDLQIDCGNFLLKGWAVDPHRDRHGLEEYDPWAGKIDYPPITPAEFVLQAMDLRSDFEDRTWWTGSEGGRRDVLFSAIWGEYTDDGSEFGHDEGRRLQGSYDFVLALLRRINMDLIIQVQIERDVRRHYGTEKYDDFRYTIPPSARIYLATAGGIIRTV